MRFRIAVTAAAVAVGAALVPTGAMAAVTTDPVDLAGAYVLDTVGVLDGREAEIETALDELYDRTQTGMFVVVVDEFTGAIDGADWADETAIRSGLGDQDLLLAIATDTREVRWSVAEDYRLADDEILAAERDGLIPALRQDRYADGVIAFADALGAPAGDTAPDLPTDTDGGSPGAIIGIVIVAGGIGILVLVAVIVIAIVVSRRGKKSVAAVETGPSQEELDRRAGSLLIALDDAVRESTQELGFAEAQFGSAAVAEFAAVLDDARGKLNRAFGIRQQLDDATPETPEEKRALTVELIGLCEEADAALDAQTDAFDRLRDLEQQAPQLVTRLRSTLADFDTRVAVARSTVQRLLAGYGLPAVDSVDDAPEQAENLAAFAAEQLARAETALAGERPGEAALAVRDAQRALGQAEELVAAVEKIDAELPQLISRLSTARGGLERSLSEARALAPASGAASATLVSAIAEAESTLATGAASDPVTALAATEASTTALDAALSSARDEQARAHAAAQQLGRLQATTRDRIAQAQSYIASHRGGVGAAARTRVAEAERLLAQASGSALVDPASALAAAQQAAAHADSALQLARNDVTRFQSEGYGGYGGYGGPSDPGGSSGGGSLGSAILGGIIGSLLSGGGSTGGFGGSSRSRSGGFGGFGSDSGRSSSRRSSSRSGSSRSSRSSSRSSSSRGGRRGGGGRF